MKVVRISERGIPGYGSYGLEVSRDEDNRLSILVLIDEKGDLTCRMRYNVFADDVEKIPNREERNFNSFLPTFCDDRLHTVASDISQLMADGRKWRKMKALLKD